jgi:hypothetical protein
MRPQTSAFSNLSSPWSAPRGRRDE